jgi:hypothetical protein
MNTGHPRSRNSFKHAAVFRSIAFVIRANVLSILLSFGGSWPQCVVCLGVSE